MLDWLADDFVRNGWRVKRFRKQDVMSTAYRQTSQRNETLDRIDPLHFDLLPKQPPHPARAKAMISMFMIRGPSQIDMFDPKPVEKIIA